MSVQPPVRAATTDLPLLSQLYCYLTQGCNLACRHCWLAPKYDATGSRYPVLPVERFETAIREAKPLGLSGVKLTGGEPLLHPEIRTLLDIVRREELSLTIETNGVLCTAELAAEIARFPDRFVSVSLDGVDAATHEQVRGVQGSFDQALAGVRNLVATGISPQIIMSVMDGNAGQVEAMVRLAEKLGASSVKFNLIQPSGRGARLHDNSHGLSVDQLIQLGRHVDTELAPATPLPLYFDYPMAFRPLSRLFGGDGCGRCGILNILGVIPTGHYALCGIGEQAPALIFGQVGVEALDEIWRNNAVLNQLRASVPGGLDGVCGRCVMKHLCLGSCIAQNYYHSGRLTAPFWFCEQAEAAGLFPESRLLPPVN